MHKIVKDGPEWRREQFISLIRRRWEEFDDDDLDKLVKFMRRGYEKYIPEGWRPKSGEAYIGCVSDILNYDYVQ